MQKKLIVILVALGFLASGVGTASAVNVQNNNFDEIEEVSSEKDVSTVTVTLFKHGIDGSRTPIEVDIELEEGQDISDAIEEKCYEILENDPEIQSLLNDNITQKLIMKIRSRGRGLHLRFNTRIQLLKLFKVFPLLPPYFRTAIIVPIVICQYTRDQRAFTTLTQIRGNNSTTVVGPQRVTSIGFYGISWWIGKVSFAGFIIRTGFLGFSLYTRIKKLSS